MKLYVETSEEEYDFYKEYKKNKNRKIFLHLLFEKENYTKMDISILHNHLEKYLFSIIEVCENTCETKEET